MEKENVLEIEYEEVFDKVAVRIKYQNFEVLKRGKFYDEETRVKSAWEPEYDKYGDKLYIQGKEEEEDSKILLVNEEDLKEILKRVNKINEKYGIPKRWRAEENEEYYYIGLGGIVWSGEELFFDEDNDNYNLGNYFRTEEEAQKIIDSKEWQDFWTKVRAGEIGK